MTDETLTLTTTGEQLLVERSTSPSGTHFVTLWTTVNGEPNEAAASIQKVFHHYGTVPKWRPTSVSLRSTWMRLDQIARHIEIAHAAAALARQLDASYPAGVALSLSKGTEVSG